MSCWPGPSPINDLHQVSILHSSTIFTNCLDFTKYHRQNRMLHLDHLTHRMKFPNLHNHPMSGLQFLNLRQSLNLRLQSLNLRLPFLSLRLPFLNLHLQSLNLRQPFLPFHNLLSLRLFNLHLRFLNPPSLCLFNHRLKLLNLSLCSPHW